MFSHKKPSLHEIVFVTLKQSNDIGNYVDLVDYDNIEGLILCTEITKYNANIKKFVKQGEIFPVIVIASDKGYDLSYSKIKEDWRILLKESYEYSTKLYKLINKLSDKLNLKNDIKENLLKINLLPKIYDDTINSKINMYKELYDNILKNPTELFLEYNNLDDYTKNNISNYITNNLIIKEYIIQKEFKLLIFESDSLTKLKEILNKIQNITNNMEYIVECKSSPIYYYRLTHVNLESIEKLMIDINEMINEIVNKTEYNCNFNFIDNYKIIKQGDTIFNF